MQVIFYLPWASYHYRAFWCLVTAFKISKKTGLQTFYRRYSSVICLALANWTLSLLQCWKAATVDTRPGFSSLTSHTSISLLVDSIYF